TSHTTNQRNNSTSDNISLLKNRPPLPTEARTFSRPTARSEDSPSPVHSLATAQPPASVSPASLPSHRSTSGATALCPGLDNSPLSPTSLASCVAYLHLPRTKETKRAGPEGPAHAPEDLRGSLTPPRRRRDRPPP